MFSRNLKQKKAQLLQKIDFELNSGSLTKSSKALNEFISLFPNSPTPYVLLADAYNKEKNYYDAFQSFKRAEELLETNLSPKSTRTDLEILIGIRNSLTGCALRHYTRNQKTKADASLVEQLVKEGYDDSFLFFVLGKEAYLKKDFSNAKTFLDKALKRGNLCVDDLITDAYFLRGMSCINLELITQGESDLKYVAEHNKDKGFCVETYLAEFYENRGEYGKSIEHGFNASLIKDNLNNPQE